MVNMKCHMKCEHRSCRAKDVFYVTDNCLETDNSVLETKIYTAKYNKSNYIPSVSLVMYVLVILQNTQQL